MLQRGLDFAVFILKGEDIVRKRAVFSIEKLVRTIENGEAIFPKQIGVPANSKGCGGIIDIALMIPESITLFVAPLACCRHVTTHVWQMTDRMYALAVEEPEIVTGKHVDMIEEAVLEIYSEMKVKPKLISICGSCIDRLMASDFERVSYDLKDKIAAEINVIWMDPVVGRKEHPQIRCWDKVFSLWNKAEGKSENTVNLIGKLYPQDEDSDLRKMLIDAGIDKVRCISDCETLEEFRSMGRAKLNIVGSKLALKAAKKVEKKYGIPYIMALPTLDPMKVHRTYAKIGDALGIEMDDTAYLRSTKMEIEAFRKKYSGRTIAVGESYAGSENAFLIAEDIAAMGMKIEWIYSDGKVEPKKEEISRLAVAQPCASVLFISHPASRGMLVEPPVVDVAWGMNEKWFAHVNERGWIDIEKSPVMCDYFSIKRFLHDVEEKLSDEEPV